MSTENCDERTCALPLNHPEEVCADMLAAPAVRELRDQLRATQAELERWRHGQQVEGDYVCPDSLELQRLKEDHAALEQELTLMLRRLRRAQEEASSWKISHDGEWARTQKLARDRAEARAEVEALRARVAELEADFTKRQATHCCPAWNDQMEDCDCDERMGEHIVRWQEAEAEVARLRESEARLRAALAKYGAHQSTCVLASPALMAAYPPASRRCGCGLEAALAGTAPTPLVPVERVKELMAEAHSLGMSDDSDSQAYAKYEALLDEVEPKKETKPTPVCASPQYVTREEWERALHDVNQRIERRMMHDDVAAEFVTREEFDNLLAQTTEDYMTVLERLEKALAARPTLDELRPVLESLRWAARGAHRPLFDALLKKKVEPLTAPPQACDCGHLLDQHWQGDCLECSCTNGRAFVPVDDDGRCTTCGLVPEEGVTHLCPPGFNGTRARGLEVLRKHPLGGWLLELLKEVKS